MEDFLEQILQTEFDLCVEDGSLEEVSTGTYSTVPRTTVPVLGRYRYGTWYLPVRYRYSFLDPDLHSFGHLHPAWLK